jgi:predicted MFS family arabinose efflux permease
VAEPLAPTEHPSRSLVVALCTATFLAALNFFAISPFVPEIADELDTSVALVGQITMVMILTSAILGLAIGPMTDEIGHRLPLVAGMVAVGINLVGLSLAQHYAVMLLLAIVGGFADAIVFSLPFAIISARFAPTQQARAVSVAFAALSAAPILGTPLLTFIGSFSGWRVALAIAGGISILAAVFTFRAIPPDQHHERPLNFSIRNLMDAYVPIWKDKRVSGVLATTLLRSITWLGAITYLGALFDDQFGLSTRAIGFIFTVAGIGAISGSLISGRVRSIPLRTMALVAFVGIGAFTAVVFSSDIQIVAVVAVFLAATCSTVGNVTTGALIMRESTAGAGTTMVLNGSLINFGSAIGTALGGLLLHEYGYRGMGVVLPIFAILAAFVLYRSGHSAAESPAVAV